MELRYQTQSFFIMLACMFFFVGCGSYQVEGEDEPTDTSGPYGIDVTLSNAQLFTPLYPLHLYFFDTQGTVTWNEEVLTQSEWPVLSMPEGEYVFSVLSGLSSGDYLPPMSLNSKQFLTFSEGNHAKTPLAIGKNVIKLQKDIKVSVSLSYAVAALYLSFGGLPAEAVSVEARISPVSSGITLEGTLSNDTILMDAGTVDASMYNAIQQKIFNATCTACHGLSTTPGGGLNLLEGHSHADLVNRASTTVDGKMRVMPGNASESVLHLILGTDISSDWRIDHSQMITSSDMQSLIGNWIDDGAQP
jgi:hypothetical protein